MCGLSVATCDNISEFRGKVGSLVYFIYIFLCTQKNMSQMALGGSDITAGTYHIPELVSSKVTLQRQYSVNRYANIYKRTYSMVHIEHRK